MTTISPFAASAPPACLVVGVTGGIGATTLAAAVGAACPPPDEAVLVDLHLRGGGIDVTVGLEHLSGPRWPDLARARGRVDGLALRRLLPMGDGCAVLAADGRRWSEVVGSSGGERSHPGESEVGSNAAGRPMADGLPTAVLTVIEALRRTGSRLVIDCPLSLLATVRRPGDALVVVASTHVRGLADLDAALAFVSHQDGSGHHPLLLVTRGGSAEAEVLDAITEQMGVPVFAHLPQDRRVVRAAMRGDWPGLSGPLRRIALDIVEVAHELAA